MKYLWIALISTFSMAESPTFQNDCHGTWSHEENANCLKRMEIQLEREKLKTTQEQNKALREILESIKVLEKEK